MARKLGLRSLALRTTGQGEIEVERSGLVRPKRRTIEAELGEVRSSTEEAPEAKSRAGENRTSLLLYVAAAVSYVAIGVFFTQFMLSWVVGFAWLLLWVCGLPALIRRLRR